MSARLRRRCLAAIGISALAGGCERERWPEPERQRPRPVAVTPGGELDCRSGEFCVDAYSDRLPAAPADPPHAECELAVPVPATAASGLAPAAVAQLRVRFDAQATTRARDAADSALPCCYRWVEHCRGRPILHAGETQLARARRRDDWCAELALEPAPRALRRALAAAWRREAAHEHASIAAFVALGRDLLLLGAPADLVGAAQQAAGDEIAHARLAYAIASANAGHAIGPGPLRLAPRPPRTLAELAAGTWLEGCVVETIAAAIARAASRRAASTTLARRLARVAADEARHAELSWRIAAWALRHGGEEAHVAVAAEVAALRPPQRRRGRPGRLEAHGIVGAAARAGIAARIHAEVVVPCTATLLG
jgi:hypothetical protein